MGWPARFRITRRNSFPILVFALFLGACGGSPANTITNPKTPPTPTTGGYAILNGTTLSGATSHWLSQDCNVQLEFASNSWMIYSVSGVGTAQATVSAVTTWSAGATDKDVAVPVPDPALFAFYLTGVTSIDGSTSSGSFNASVTILETATGSHVYTCPFVLQSGPIPGFQTSH